ncbi:MAG: DoxX family membrane protein, partial [Deltaproteobacteria bacterium]|nr:DoxX family membrane protein [Deltaproteobacteria bacterium]
MKKLLLHPIMLWICRLAVAYMLIYAAVQKIWMPLEFARLLKEYHLLPNQILNLVAVVLPWAEIVCGFCFIS